MWGQYFLAISVIQIWEAVRSLQSLSYIFGFAEKLRLVIVEVSTEYEQNYIICMMFILYSYIYTRYNSIRQYK